MMRNTEVLNELILVLSIYVLPTFGDFIPNDAPYEMANYRFGWVFCAILAPMLLFNFVMIFVEVLIIFFKGIKQQRKEKFDTEVFQKKELMRKHNGMKKITT